MIKFQHIQKEYKQHKVLADLSFTINRGEVVVLIGPSGCGKTTTLKMINRLISPTSGRILINDKDIGTVDPVRLRRNMGYVIQQTGLFPHLTVRENLEIIPSLEKYDKQKIAARTVELMEMVNLNPGDFLDRYPTQLSGGQQQRVGVARAFACDPEIILMDEPFSAIDPITRTQLQDELASIQERVRKTIVFVTHDIAEAVKVGDRICIMNDGGIVQYDTCEEILKNPATDFVKDFVGTHRIWTAPELIKAKDIMIEPVTCPCDTTVLRCMERFKKSDQRHMLLTDRSRLVGIVSLAAVRSCKEKNSKVMALAKTEFPTIGPDDSIIDILEMVNSGEANIVPVVDGAGGLRGVITQSSLISTLSQQFMAGGEESQ